MAHPITAMHCRVIFLHGKEPYIWPDIMLSPQSIVAIAAIDIVLPWTGLIAIAVDCPNRPRTAINSRKGRKKGVT